MSENFNDKDYGEYFRSLEEEIERKSRPASKQEEALPTAAEQLPQKRIFTRTVRLRRSPIIAAVALILVAAIAVGIVTRVSGKAETGSKENKNIAANKDDVKDEELFRPTVDENTAEPSEEIESKHIIMIDTDTRRVVAARNPDERTAPASTTKIMTALVACENITNFDDTFKMLIEITDPIYLAGATSAGFSIGEEITMTDMLYGCILPSGGDAALGLAYKISGDEESFVELMNEKCRELGLENTHFTNVTGLHDKEHYSTAADMAVILEAAMQDPMCRKLLSTFQYTTSKTEQHPDGITLTSTLFSYMYGTEPETAQIDGGKTGYVNESGFCIASYGHASDGSQYICVTLDASTRWPAVFDQIELYKAYAK